MDFPGFARRASTQWASRWPSTSAGCARRSWSTAAWRCWRPWDGSPRCRGCRWEKKGYRGYVWYDNIWYIYYIYIYMYHIIYISYICISYIYICIVDSCVAYLFLSLSLSLSLSVSVSIYLSTNELLCLCIVNMWYVICQMPSNDFNSWTFWAILSWADGRVCNGNHEVLNHDVLGGWMVGGWGHYEFMNLIIWYQGGFTVRSSNQSGSNLFWHPQSKPLDWNVLIATQSRYLLIDLKHRHLLVSGSQGPGSASPWRCLPDLHHRSTWCHGEVWLHAADLGLSAVVATSGQRFQKWGTSWQWTSEWTFLPAPLSVVQILWWPMCRTVKGVGLYIYIHMWYACQPAMPWCVESIRNLYHLFNCSKGVAGLPRVVRIPCHYQHAGESGQKAQR